MKSLILLFVGVLGGLYFAHEHNIPPLDPEVVKNLLRQFQGDMSFRDVPVPQLNEKTEPGNTASSNLLRQFREDMPFRNVSTPQPNEKMEPGVAASPINREEYLSLPALPGPGTDEQESQPGLPPHTTEPESQLILPSDDDSDNVKWYNTNKALIEILRGKS